MVTRRFSTSVRVVKPRAGVDSKGTFMASRIRSRRTVFAAGALTLALAAPLTPVAPEAFLPQASAQTVDYPLVSVVENNVFDTRYLPDTNQAIVLDLDVPCDATVTTHYGWKTPAPRADDQFKIDLVSNDSGTACAIRVKEPVNVTKGGGEGGRYTIPVRIVIPDKEGRTDSDPASGIAYQYSAFLKFNMNRKPEWVQNNLRGFDNSPQYLVDFSEDATQLIAPEEVEIPVNAKVFTETKGWTWNNRGGKLELTPPTSWDGRPVTVEGRVRVDDPQNPNNSWSERVKIYIENSSENPPAGYKSTGDQISDILGGGGGAAGILGALLGLVAGGGGAGGAGLLPGLNSLISLNIPDAKIDIHGNSINDSGNPIVEVKDNKAEVRDNNAYVDIPVNVTDNFKDNDVAENFEGLLGGSGGSSSKGSKGTSGSNVTAGGNVSADGGSSSGGVNNPKCVGSLVGFGVPLAIMIPVLAANVFRIPGFEGIQNAMKAAAGMAPGLNIPPEQVAAGVGAAAGAASLAGLIATLATCIPQK